MSKMKDRKSVIFMTFLVLLVSMEATTTVVGDSKGNNGKGNDKKGKDNGTGYKVLKPNKGKKQERASCQAQGQCYGQILECPPECPERKPKKNKKVKGCYMDCNSKCETVCKFRKPKCEGYGSICYDPRLVGGDGVMFYFHGAKGGNFALVSDDQLHINGHFIGTRPSGRTRDFTWVQALSIFFDSHTLILAAAKKVSHWDDAVDNLIVRWDGDTVQVPTDGEAEWRTNEEGREVVVERTDDANSVRVSVSGLLEMDVKVTPIGAEENRVHNYQLPSDDVFAHLETQFKFKNLTEMVEGVLGKTYRPEYVSPVKVGVAMPMMGGEDKYRTPSLLSPLCNVCRFKGVISTTAVVDETGTTVGIAQY
ncbi:hypothetical protein Sjap_013895 [Stephania japonica]|uniref:Uncharacterized protein n=1 Tax=Stephania japonica TaxID=461633 RepID=A0AAP0J0K9_9MAGN